MYLTADTSGYDESKLLQFKELILTIAQSQNELIKFVYPIINDFQEKIGKFLEINQKKSNALSQNITKIKVRLGVQSKEYDENTMIMNNQNEKIRKIYQSMVGLHILDIIEFFNDEIERLEILIEFVRPIETLLDNIKDGFMYLLRYHSKKLWTFRNLVSEAEINHQTFDEHFENVLNEAISRRSVCFEEEQIRKSKVKKLINCALQYGEKIFL